MTEPTIAHHSTIYELESDPTPAMRLIFYTNGTVIISISDFENNAAIVLSPEKRAELRELLG